MSLPADSYRQVATPVGDGVLTDYGAGTGKLRAAAANLLNGYEQLDVGSDTAVTHLDHVDQLGRHTRTGDARVNVGAPVHCGISVIDGARQQAVTGEAKGLHQHREPGTDPGNARDVDRDGLTFAGSGDPEVCVGCEESTQLVQ